MSRFWMDMLALIGVFGVLSVYEFARVAHQKRVVGARRVRPEGARTHVAARVTAENVFGIARNARRSSVRGSAVRNG